MSQPFNNFTGNPRQSNDNPFGELTSSLIFPGSLPFQQTFQSGWLNPQPWQANGQNSFNMGDFYQGQLTGSNGYFSTQQDYAEADEGDDFYTNGEEDAAAGQGANGPSIKAVANGQHTSSIQQEQVRDAPMHLNKAISKPQNSNRQQIKIQNSPFVTTEDPKAKLAELRAKLVASKKMNGGKTPTPEPKSNTQMRNGKSPRIDDGVAKNSKSSVAGSLIARTTNQFSLGALDGAGDESIPSILQKNDKAPPQSEVLLAKQSTSSTDIDALFDEIRASEDAKNQKQPLKHKPEDKAESKEHLVNGQASKDPTQSGKVATPPTSKADKPVNSSRQAPKVSKSSSETSEQGEIREERKPTHVESSKIPPSEQAKNPKEKTKSNHEGKVIQSSNKPTTKLPPPKIDTTVVKEGKAQRGPTSAKTKTPISARVLAPSKPREDRESRLSSEFWDSSRDRPLEHSRLVQDRRPDHDRDRPTDGYHRYNGSYYDGTSRRRQNYSADQTEQAAAEYKRALYVRQISREEIPQHKPFEDDQVAPKVQASEQLDDIQEWLEMTGYFDKSYREKALVRHRKLVELDKQRAELERESQIDHEERLQISRALSVRPRESIEGAIALRASIAPQVPTSTSMPPPPIPTKDVGDDLGIQIKDLAARDTAAVARRNEDDLRASRQAQDSPGILTPSLKRQHSPDTYDSPTNRPLEKIARTNSRDYSFDKKTQSSPAITKATPPALESRIIVDNGMYRRNYQARSRSRSRRRSLTPPFRHGSGSEMSAARFPSRVRNDFSSGRSRGGDISPSGRDRGPAYDDDLDGNTRGRFSPYSYDYYDNRSNFGYDSYSTNNHRGGFNAQWTGPNHRGRGRGKGRGNYIHNRGGGSSRPNDRSGSE